MTSLLDADPPAAADELIRFIEEGSIFEGVSILPVDAQIPVNDEPSEEVLGEYAADQPAYIICWCGESHSDLSDACVPPAPDKRDAAFAESLLSVESDW